MTQKSIKARLSGIRDIRKKKSGNIISSKKIDNIQLFILSIPAIVIIFVFAYIPMGGIVIAFKDFKVPLGIFKSPWVGFRNFEFFFVSEFAWRTIRNTLGMNFLMMSAHLVFDIAFAMMCFRIRNRLAVKFYQTVTIIPNFLSWVVVGYLVYSLLKPVGGLANRLIEAFGGTPVQWYMEPGKWPVILLITSLWHGVGRGSLFYFATLVGIESDYFEAAAIDGATKWQEFRYIILPFLTPTIIILQILAIGRIFRADFGLFFNVTRDMGPLYPTTDVIDTYIYRALFSLGDICMSSAVGAFQSVIGFVLVLTTNYIVRKIEPDYSFF